MKNNKIKNNYLICCTSCILILMTICYFGINFVVSDTFAGFGGITGCMNASIDLEYSPNYPDGFELPEVVVKKVCSNYIVLDNMYNVPLGYEFIGWNTIADGTGTMYYANSIMILSDNVTIYAQWKKLKILYGDLNSDSNISEEDYLLLKGHLDGSNVLDGLLLLSADVNGDLKVDDIDLDILKHVNLGTLGYVGYLPNDIVPIYDIYVSKDIENEDSNDSNEDDNKNTVMGEGGSGHASGNGSGTGGSGSGNSSVGTGSGSIKPKPGNNKDSNNSSNNEDNSIDQDIEEVFEPRTYNFKFIVDGVEYDNTKCDTGNSKTCKLVLPEDTPFKKGYRFNGWSNDIDCPSNIGINYTVLMEGDASYYACFLEIEDNNIYNIIIISLIIVLVWVCAIFGIIYLIKRFKNTDVKN